MTTDSKRYAVLAILAAACLAAGPCDISTPATDSGDDGTPTDTATSTDVTPDDSGETPDATADEDDAAGDTTGDTTGDTAGDTGEMAKSVSEQVVRQLDDYTLEAGEETIPCFQWSLNNEEPLYVNTVTLANEGGFHHSNWYIAPEDYAAGPDGYFNCNDRGYQGFTAATQGTVLFAQSTQAKSEVQSFPPGVVTKIPPNHKIIADLHFLNIKPRQFTTSARLTLGLVHPRDVDTVAVPFVLTYDDLHIPPKSEARFESECNFAGTYRDVAKEDFDMELYYVLPHYHGLGNYFNLEISGGPRDGEQIFELEGFNAEANGQEFDPPIELSDAEGFRFSCGYDNPRDELVEWGIGGDEMCMMLGYGSQKTLLAGRIRDNEVGETKDGIIHNSGHCTTTALPVSESQTMPTDEEKSGEMYLPESDTPQDLDPVPECEDRPGTAEPFREPTLQSLETNLFSAGCAFSSCHDGEAPAADLNLVADDLHAELMNHEMSTPTDMPLVDPGNPDGSWLYEVTSNCEPESDVGPVSHMPRNSPTLLEPDVVAMIREWIARGAQDN